MAPQASHGAASESRRRAVVDLRRMGWPGGGDRGWTAALDVRCLAPVRITMTGLRAAGGELGGRSRWSPPTGVWWQSQPVHQAVVYDRTLVVATDLITSIANVAAAVGVVVVIFQLALARRQMRAGFERSFVDKYERIIERVPLAMLLGDDVDVDRSEKVQRAFFDYFELCEEELYFRRVGKVSSATWQEWWEGISLHFRRPAFIQGWESLKDRVLVRNGDSDLVRLEQFTLLREALAAIERGQIFDPCKSWRRIL